MIARSVAVVSPGGRVSVLASQPPLTLRQVRTDAAATAALCLVGSAAGPLAGDDLHLRLEVRSGARAEFGAAGAAIAQGRGQCSPAVLTTSVSVADHAALTAAPAPLVLCAGSRVESYLDIDLAETASMIWRELLVMGRTGEPAGAAVVHWQVRRAGRPLLRQTVDLANPATRSWSGMLRGQRVMATALISRPGIATQTIIASPTAVVQTLDHQSALITVLAGDAAEAANSLDDLCDRVLRPVEVPSYVELLPRI